MRNLFNQSENSVPRIGDQAPAFRAVTTKGSIYFPADYFGKWVVLFSYPTDFKLSSASEVLFFTVIYNELKSLDCDLVGLSVQGNCSYNKLHPITENSDVQGKNDFEVNFPVIENTNMDVIWKYGMIHSGKDNHETACRVLIIDPQCIIRGKISYSQSLAYSFDKLKKLIVALQTRNSLDHTLEFGLSERDEIIPTYLLN